jgi:hypothetical protein
VKLELASKSSRVPVCGWNRGTSCCAHSAWQCSFPGEGRVLCCGGRRHTDANANCYSHTDGNANRQPHCHAATDANAEVGANSKAAAHASAAALDFGPPKISEHRGHGCT